MNSDDDTEQPAPSTFDAEATAQMLGLSGKQLGYCLAVARGANQTQAAKAAGYGGTADQLRTAGSRVARSKKVMRFLELMRLEGGQTIDRPADYAELERVLSRTLRGADSNSAIRAAEVLHRIRDAARKSDQPDMTPAEALSEIAKISPEMAASMAAADGIEFEMDAEHREAAARHVQTVAEGWIRNNATRAIQIATFFANGGGAYNNGATA